MDSKIEKNQGNGISVGGSAVANDELTLDGPILKVQNCYALNNGRQGISVQLSGASPQQHGKRNLVTVLDSDVSDNSSTGISVAGLGLDSKRNFISGNYMGIHFRSGSYLGHHLNIENNLIRDNQKMASPLARRAIP